MLRSLLLAALAVLLLSPLASAQTAAPTACGYEDQEIRIDVVGASSGQLIVEVFTSDGVRRDSTTVTQTTDNGCGLLIETNDNGSAGPTLGAYRNWVFGNPATDTALRLLTIRFTDIGSFEEPMVWHYTYNVCGSDDKLNGFGFYCSRVGVAGGSDDLRFRYDTAQDEILVQPDAIPLGANDSVADFFPGEEDDWILPYNLKRICDAASAPGLPCNGKSVFVSPVHGDPTTSSPITPQYRDWTFTDDDIIVDANAVGFVAGANGPIYRGYVWELGGKSVHFQPNRRLIIEGEFSADDATLTAADPVAGWFGIRATGSVAKGTLDNTTVDGVNYAGQYVNPASPFPPYAALTVTNDATVSVKNDSEILNSVNANGVVASLSGSSVFVFGASEIKDNADGLGALASAGAEIQVSGTDTSIRGNDLGGVWATGSGSEIEIQPGATVELNSDGYGATSTASGTVRLITPSGLPSVTGPTGNPTVENNDGGLDTRSSGYAFTGSCNDLTGVCTDGIASVSDNNLTGEKDARANSASAITAQKTFWNGRTQQSQLTLVAGRTSLITVAPLSATTSLTGGAPTASNKGGDSDAAPTAAQARQLAMDGDIDAASRLLSEALLTTTEADIRTALYSAAVYVAARGLSPLLRSQLATTAAQEGHESGWAQHALAVDAVHRQDDSAWNRAEALSRIADRRAFGHTLMLRMAIGDERRALDALSAFAAVTGAEASDDEREALTSALAVVVAAYPDADLRSALDRTPEAPQAKSGTDVRTATLDAYPNPAAGQARVAFSVTDASEATIAVYDALGRRVATLHDGDLAEGDHAFELPGDALAPGVYVVTSRTTSTSGAVSTETVRWTRMR